MDRQPQSITEVVAATLREMGLAADAAALTRTILIRDGYFAGHKYRFDGGYALWLTENSVLEVYDDAKQVLKTVGGETSHDKRAA
jgi:hypothetical protein